MIITKTYETETFNEKYDLTAEEIKGIKKEFAATLFEMKVNLYKNSRSSQWVNTELVCTNEKFNAWLNSLYSRKFRSVPKEEFISEAAAVMTHAIYSYKGNKDEDFNWKGLLTNNEESLSQIFAYLKLPVESGMLDFRNYWNNIDLKQQTITVDGNKEKINIWRKANINSLDQDLTYEDGTSDTVLSLLGEESSLFFVDEYEDADGNIISNYQANHFLQWFRENYTELKKEIEAKREKEEKAKLAGLTPKNKRLKNSFLTEIQFDYLEAKMKYPDYHFEDFHYSSDQNKAQTFEELTGISPQDASLYKKNIINRISKQFEKDNPLGKKSNLQLRKEKQIEFWSDFIYLVYCEEDKIDQQNELLSAFIVENMNNPFMNDILYDNLEGEDIFNVVSAIGGGTIRGKTLYKIIELVEKKLIFLEDFDTSAVKFYRKESENNGWPKERHQAFAKQREQEASEASLIKVLKWSDIEQDYVYVRTEIYQKGNQPGKKKHFRENFMTTGATYKVDSDAE